MTSVIVNIQPFISPLQDRFMFFLLGTFCHSSLQRNYVCLFSIYIFFILTTILYILIFNVNRYLRIYLYRLA